MCLCTCVLYRDTSHRYHSRVPYIVLRASECVATIQRQHMIEEIRYFIRELTTLYMCVYVPSVLPVVGRTLTFSLVVG